MHTQKRVGSSSCSGDTFLFLTLDSRREMRGRLCTHTTMVVGGYMDGTTKNWRDVSCHATQFKVNRRGINFLPGFLFLVCFVFLLSIQFSAYCRGRCRPLNISMDDAKNGPVNFRLTELWRRARLYTIFIRIFLPLVCLVRVSRVCDGWIDLIIHGCYKGMCVCIQQRGASHISPSSEGLGLETAVLHTHTDISCLIIWRRPAVTHVETRCTCYVQALFSSSSSIQPLFFFFGRAAAAGCLSEISDDWFMSRPHLFKLVVAREGLLSCCLYRFA